MEIVKGITIFILALGIIDETDDLVFKCKPKAFQDASYWKGKLKNVLKICFLIGLIILIQKFL